jgi:Domain of unknown function (DUF6894)
MVRFLRLANYKDLTASALFLIEEGRSAGSMMSLGREHSVPRYFFNLVRENREVIDREGVEIVANDLQAAIIMMLEEMQSEEPELFDLEPGWSLVVIDEEHHEVMTFPLSRAAER